MTSAEIAQFSCIPKFFGQPMYDAAGMPCRLENIQWVDGETLQEKWIKRVNCKVALMPVDPEDEKLLVQWVIYYLNAPMWSLANNDGWSSAARLVRSLQADISLDDLIKRCLDIGIDPL